MCLSCHILLVVLQRSVLVDREEQSHRMCEGVRSRLLQGRVDNELKSSEGLVSMCYCELGFPEDQGCSLSKSI